MSKPFRVLIVGANFTNKGAQSMLFITVDEIKKRRPDCEIYFGTFEYYDKSLYDLYTFREFFYSEDAKDYALADGKASLRLKLWCKDVIKFCLNRRINLFRYKEVAELFPTLDLVIDVSGFNIGKKWDINGQKSYLNNIRLARKYKIPMILMPQSFGPFDYPQEKEFLLAEIAELLPYPQVIFAREEEGCQMLLDQFSLSNVRLSTDLVLQNKGVDPSNIYRDALPPFSFPEIKKPAVAVIPNSKCFDHGNADQNLALYRSVISHLLECGKNVYIFHHSTEDVAICRQIAGQFKDSHVMLLEQDFSCLEYDAFIRNFDFAICSRFHGIVHAYRNSIPCILLGWAVKYVELARNVGQEQFAFDITDPGFHASLVNASINELSASRDENSKIIEAHVTEIQRNNCFDQIAEYLHS